MVRAAVAQPSSALRARLSALSERRRSALALAGCLLLALLLRTPYLSVPLGRDEGGLAFIARHWQGGSLYGDYWVDRPPLLIGLFKVAVLGGDSGVRVLGAVAGLALVVSIALLARAVAGPRAGGLAGLLAAVLTASITIGAVYTCGELLAAVPSTLSVLCLVLAHRSRRLRYVFAAGALAVGAALVKQSFLDAGVAGVVFVAMSAAGDRNVRVRWPLAYCAGAALPLLAVLTWLAAAQVSLDYFIYTLFRFRLDLLHTLAGSNIPLHVRLTQLGGPAWESGLLLAMAGAVAGLLYLRRERVLLWTFAAWLAAATVGVLGGGSYFVHYLVQLVPVSCVAAAVALTGTRPPIRIVALAAFAYLALAAANDGASAVARHVPHRRELAIGHYIRDHARPGDTQYVLYARANVVYYAGLPQPYPYLWSLMVRVRPGARARLERLLGSSRRPTWVVQWQPTSDWELDPDNRLQALLTRGYRTAAVLCGFPIYVRNDYAAPPPLTFPDCP